MKLLLILLFPMLAIAQSKGDNAIIISDSLTPASIIKTFVMSGYGMDKSADGYYSTIVTDKKGMGLKFAILKQDSSYLLQGWWNSNTELTIWGATAKSEWVQISKLGKMFRQDMFDEMVNIAGKLGKDFKYVKL